MANMTTTQGRYLSFIHAYILRHGYPPAESDIAAALCVSPPSVNQMVKMLEKKGLILRHPGQPRSLQILIPEDEIPPWNARRSAGASTTPARRGKRPATPAPEPPTNLYVMTVILTGSPVGDEFANKMILRGIEIRGDQTLDDLHRAIFEAFNRSDERPYEFQFGKRPFDPDGAVYGLPDALPPKQCKKSGRGDARTTTLDDLNLQPNRAFGYWFDFEVGWYHQVQVDRIERAIPTVPYPRVTKRVGKAPPQRIH
ncbi:MAG: IS1096 element passenger TnpR family protein [Isosphaeraceae bacterium]